MNDNTEVIDLQNGYSLMQSRVTIEHITPQILFLPPGKKMQEWQEEHIALGGTVDIEYVGDYTKITTTWAGFRIEVRERRPEGV